MQKDNNSKKITVRRKVRPGDIYRLNDDLHKIYKISYQKYRRDKTFSLIFETKEGKLLAYDSKVDKGNIILIEESD